MTDPSLPRLISLPQRAHLQGVLIVAEAANGLPFVPQRSYWVTDIPSGVQRGGHAHRRCEEFLVALSGSCRAVLRQADGTCLEFTLDDPAIGLYLPPSWWRDIDNYAPSTICLVLASEPYDETDYRRNPTEFFADRSAFQS